MSKIVVRLMFVLLSILSSLMSIAQDNASREPAMADTMRSNGKIYVVVAVCLTILLGLFSYVFIIDRKISRLEKPPVLKS